MAPVKKSRISPFAFLDFLMGFNAQEEVEYLKEAKSKYCGECHRDFKPGEIVHFAWIENRSFCGKCQLKLQTVIRDWEPRQVPIKEV